jgi:mono/diheme cytochrome c family protein
MARRALGVSLVLVGIVVALGVASCGTSTPPLVGNAAAGEAVFTSTCQQCHNFGELKPLSNLIVNEMVQINPAMFGILLTDQQVADLQAFLL